MVRITKKSDYIPLFPPSAIHDHYMAAICDDAHICYRCKKFIEHGDVILIAVLKNRKQAYRIWHLNCANARLIWDVLGTLSNQKLGDIRGFASFPRDVSEKIVAFIESTIANETIKKVPSFPELIKDKVAKSHGIKIKTTPRQNVQRLSAFQILSTSTRRDGEYLRKKNIEELKPSILLPQKVLDKTQATLKLDTIEIEKPKSIKRPKQLRSDSKTKNLCKKPKLASTNVEKQKCPSKS